MEKKENFEVSPRKQCIGNEADSLVALKDNASDLSRTLPTELLAENGSASRRKTCRYYTSFPAALRLSRA